MGSKKLPPSDLPPTHDLAALLDRVVDVLLHLGDGGLVDQRAGGDALLGAVAHLQLLHGLGQLLGEGVIDAVLHQHAVGADAGLAGVAVLRHHGALHGRIEVGIVEDDEGRIAAEFEADLLDGRRALRHQHAADFGRAGEGQRTDDGVRGHLRADLAREPVMTEKTPAGMPARSASSASARAESGVSLAGLQTKAQPAASAGPGLAGDHRIGEVPRRDGGDDAHRLLDHDHAAIGPGRGNGLAIDALGLFGEELDEGRAIGDFAARFGQRLALLGGHDLGQVLLVLHHQVEPLAQDGGAFLGGLLRPVLLGALGSLDGGFGSRRRRASERCRSRSRQPGW